MRVMPSKETLEEAIKASEEIRLYESKMRARGYGFSKVDLGDIFIYSGLSKKGIRIMIGDRPLADFPSGERIAIWKDLKDLIK